MKKAIPILLIFVLGLQVSDKLWIICAFQINQDYIIENFCENKDKPLIDCGGQCHLNKQLQTSEEKENQILKIIKSTFEVFYYSNEEATDFERRNVQISNAMNSFYVVINASLIVVDIFHPPRIYSYNPLFCNSYCNHQARTMII